MSVLDNGMGIADHVVEAPDGQGEVVSERTDDSMDGLQMALRGGDASKSIMFHPSGVSALDSRKAASPFVTTRTRVLFQNKNRFVALA